MANKKDRLNRYKGEIIFYAVCLALLVIGIFYDNQVAGFLAKNRIGFLTEIMKAISFLGKWYIVLSIAALLAFSYEKNKKKNMIYLWLSILISNFIILALKLAIMRERPIFALEEIAARDSSFPSSHATGVFALVPLLLNKKIKALWLVFAILVAFSRIYLGVHYLSDVVAGMMIGYGVGMIIKLWKK